MWVPCTSFLWNDTLPSFNEDTLPLQAVCFLSVCQRSFTEINSQVIYLTNAYCKSCSDICRYCLMLTVQQEFNPQIERQTLVMYIFRTYKIGKIIRNSSVFTHIWLNISLEDMWHTGNFQTIVIYSALHFFTWKRNWLYYEDHLWSPNFYTEEEDKFFWDHNC